MCDVCFATDSGSFAEEVCMNKFLLDVLCVVFWTLDINKPVIKLGLHPGIFSLLATKTAVRESTDNTSVLKCLGPLGPVNLGLGSLWIGLSQILSDYCMRILKLDNYHRCFVFCVFFEPFLRTCICVHCFVVPCRRCGWTLNRFMLVEHVKKGTIWSGIL